MRTEGKWHATNVQRAMLSSVSYVRRTRAGQSHSKDGAAKQLLLRCILLSIEQAELCGQRALYGTNSQQQWPHNGYPHVGTSGTRGRCPPTQRTRVPEIPLDKTNKQTNKQQYPHTHHQVSTWCQLKNTA